MKYLLPLLAFTLLGSGCVCAEQASVERQIAFSADFANGSGCTSAKDAAGCDLYMATITSDGAVLNVTRLTDTTLSESFPDWHPIDNIIYFDSQQSGEKYSPPDIHYLIVDTGETDILTKYAAHASVVPTGDAIIYSQKPEHVLTRGSLSASHTTMTDTEVLVAGEDRFEPTVSGDGNLVVFHEISDTNAGASIYNIQTEQMTSISTTDGTGHCTMNDAGTLAMCDRKTGGGLAGTPIVSGEIGTTTPAVADPSIAAIQKLDKDYADCDLASVNFPTFFDDDTLLVTISCHQRDPEGMASPLFAKLFLVELETDTFIPLGKQLAETYGGAGQDSRTAAARP